MEFGIRQRVMDETNTSWRPTLAVERNCGKPESSTTHIKFWVEEDTQWVFITNLRLMADRSLFVRDENARCYSVDLKRHRVHKASCGTVFTQAVAPQ